MVVLSFHELGVSPVAHISLIMLCRACWPEGGRACKHPGTRHCQATAQLLPQRLGAALPGTAGVSHTHRSCDMVSAAGQSIVSAAGP